MVLTATHLTRAGFNPPLLIGALQMCSHSALAATPSEVPADKSTQLLPMSTSWAQRVFPKGTPQQFFAPKYRIQSASLQGKCRELKSPQQGVPVQSGTTYPSREGSFAPSSLPFSTRKAGASITHSPMPFPCRDKAGSLLLAHLFEVALPLCITLHNLVRIHALQCHAWHRRHRPSGKHPFASSQ